MLGLRFFLHLNVIGGSMNRKIVSVALCLIVVASMVGLYVASAKSEGGSPWESILDVFVTGGSVEVSGTVGLEEGTEVDVSGSVSLDYGSKVGVYGEVALEAGTEVDVSGSVSLDPGSEVEVYGEVSLEAGTEVGVSGEVSISGPVSIDGPVTLAPGSTVEALMATEVTQVFYGNLDPWTGQGWYVDVDGYKTVHVYFLYSIGTYPDAYSLSYDFSIPDPQGGNRLTWQSENLPGPGVYSLEVTGPQLWLWLYGRPGADETECKLFVYAQSE